MLSISTLAVMPEVFDLLHQHIGSNWVIWIICFLWMRTYDISTNRWSLVSILSLRHLIWSVVSYIQSYFETRRFPMIACGKYSNSPMILFSFGSVTFKIPSQRRNRVYGLDQCSLLLLFPFSVGSRDLFSSCGLRLSTNLAYQATTFKDKIVEDKIVSSSLEF